ncbi:heterogeneous nuclear ribonucleoprotein Q-like isoform X2 [Symsagittifera roscoffensis]
MQAMGGGAQMTSFETTDQYATPQPEMVGGGYEASGGEYGVMDYDAVGDMGGGAVGGGMYGMGGMGSMHHQQGAMGMYGGGGGFQPMAIKCGPNEDAMSAILARTGYPHEVTPSLRRYGGPPPDWTGPKPTQGVEVFLGKLPEDLYEDELIPLMEKCGKIYELRVIVDKEGYNRGFGFVTFCDKESAKNAVNTYANYRIRGRKIVCNLNVQFTKLYVGGIPKDKTREQIFSAFSQEVEKLTDVVIQEPDDVSSLNGQNRGFCFLEFDCYFDAAAARRKLMSQRSSIAAWDNYRKFKVDWAIPLDNPDEAVANRSTVILVTKLNDSVTQGDLHEKFGKHGVIKSCNKTGQHAFITYQERSGAESAVEAENHQFIKDCQMEVTIHVPLTPIAKRMVEAIKGPRGGANFAPGMHPGGRGGAMGGSFGGRPRGRGGMGGMNAYQMGGMGRQDGFRGRGGGFGGMGRGGRGFGMGGGRGGGGMFNPMERAGSFTRARLMNRGGSIFGDRGGAALQGGAYNPYGLQRGSGVYKNKQRGFGGNTSMHGGGGNNSFAMQTTYSQLGSSFTQF